MDAPDWVLGTWQCVSALTFSDAAYTQTLNEPFGPKPLGRVTFTPDGYMSAILTHPDYAAPLDKPWRSGATDAEVAQVARAMSSYCGPYQVSQREGETFLSTSVEISLEPNWIGTIQERKISFGELGGEKTMILRPVQPLLLVVRCPDSLTSPCHSYISQGGKKGYGVLTWVKVDLERHVRL